MLFDAEVMEASNPSPPRGDLFIVIAYYSSGVWTIPSMARGPWLTQEAAQAAADKLSGAWNHRRIVRIPGDQP